MKPAESKGTQREQSLKRRQKPKPGRNIMKGGWEGGGRGGDRRQGLRVRRRREEGLLAT